MKSLVGSSAKLRHVALVFRHGDRASSAPGASGAEAEAEREAWSSALPCNKLTDRLDKAFPVKSQASGPPHGTDAKPFEMLTHLGGRQLSDFGRQLRQSYGLLRTEVEASNFRRTQQSAQFFLMGFYGLTVSDLTENVDSVFVRSKEDCLIDSFSRHMQNLLPRIRSVEATQNFAAREEEGGPLFDVKEQLKSMPLFGADGKMPGRFSWLHAWDVLTCLRAHDELPKLETLHALLHLQPAAAQEVLWRFSKYYEDAELLRLTAGDLLKEMSQQMDKCTQEDESGQRAKLVVYSGHDTTMMPLLKALSLWDGKWPPFAAEIRLELWKVTEGNSGDTWHVRAVGSQVGDGATLRCSLRDFQLRVQQVATGAGPALPPNLWSPEE